LSLCSVAVVAHAANPIATNLFTADPAALVRGDTMYVYTGHDEASATATGFVMKNWHVFSSTDMSSWKDHGAVLGLSTFSWASANAWAGHVVERGGKFYWYVTVSPRSGGGFAIGVAVGPSPTGPWKDALGKALITDGMTSDIQYDIDPAIFIDYDGQAYIYWGNGGHCKGYKLGKDMISLVGSMVDVSPSFFTEAAWVHKRNGVYFLTYAAGWPETIDYATSRSPLGPFRRQGTLNVRMSSETNHQSVVEYHNQWYFVYHTGDIGGNYRRSVAVDRLFYTSDTTIAQIVRTKGLARMDHAPLADGTYRLKARHSGMYVEDASGKVRQGALSKSDNQIWNLARAPGQRHVYTLRNIGTGTFLSPKESVLRDSISTQSTEKAITIENSSIDDGYLLFTDTARDYVADVLNLSTESGARLVTWRHTGATNQTFLFEKATSTSVGDLPDRPSRAEIVGMSRTMGVALDREAEWSLFDPAGTLLRSGTSAHVPLHDLPTGRLFLRVDGQTFNVAVFR
jgi:hypothetical protein